MTQYFENLNDKCGMKMIHISSGSFIMGDDKSTYNDEKPAHRVDVGEFWMGETQVTQEQWKAVMGVDNNPSYFKGDDLPVENVSWSETQEFCQRLSQLTDKQYRLPSEAEWEYACRAGTFGDYAGDLDEMAWYINNSEYKTHPVGTKRPNDFGLYDMHGNVWEWCYDNYHSNYEGAPADGSAWVDISAQGEYSVLRGGSWNNNSENCRSANRNDNAPGVRGLIFGFRVVVSSEFTNKVTRSVPPSYTKKMFPVGTKFIFNSSGVILEGLIIKHAPNVEYVQVEYCGIKNWFSLEEFGKKIIDVL